MLCFVWQRKCLKPDLIRFNSVVIAQYVSIQTMKGSLKVHYVVLEKNTLKVNINNISKEIIHSMKIIVSSEMWLYDTIKKWNKKGRKRRKDGFTGKKWSLEEYLLSRCLSSTQSSLAPSLISSPLRSFCSGSRGGGRKCELQMSSLRCRCAHLEAKKH